MEFPHFLCMENSGVKYLANKVNKRKSEILKTFFLQILGNNDTLDGSVHTH